MRRRRDAVPRLRVERELPVGAGLCLGTYGQACLAACTLDELQLCQDNEECQGDAGDASLLLCVGKVCPGGTHVHSCGGYCPPGF